MPDPKNLTLRGLAHDLRDASDSAILRITQVIDTMPDRGATDQLLDGLRPRLSSLRPPRPRTLARELFTPLDPVIVASGAWRPGLAAIRRSVIAPVTALVREHLPDAVATEASLAAGGEPDGQLWERAASVLAEAPLPAAWSLPSFQAATGLKPQMMPPILGVIRLVFGHVSVLRRFPFEYEPSYETIRPLLLEAARSGPLAWSIVLALLFEQTPAPAALVEHVLALAAGTGLARQLEKSLQDVIRTVIEKLDHPAQGMSQGMSQDGPQTALSDDALHAQAQRAARLAGFSALRGDMHAFAGALAQRRRQMAAQCSAQLASGLRHAPEACVPPGPLEPQAEQEAAERLESRLRALRRLDLAARPLGDVDGREALLAEAAAFYSGDTAPGWLTPADRLRLCEILVGAEAALRLAAPDGAEARR
jgi:hypothetical protein